MLKAEDIKRHEREAYDAVAEVFDSVLASYNARFAGDLIDLMFPQKGELALDVAGGTGAAAFKLVERIGKEGKVTIVDISPGMLQQAEKNARARGLANIETRVMDAEHLDFPDAGFDMITCSMGIMFFPNIRQAIAEAWRVLKPGGRIGYTVWSVPERFPFFSYPMTAVVRRMAPAPIRLLLRLPGIGTLLLRRILISRLPTGFSPVRFSAKGSLEKHLLRAGFQSVRRELRAYPIQFANFNEYWNAITKGTPAKEMENRVPARILAEVKDEVRAQLTNPKTNVVYFHNEAALILGKKPI